MSTPPRKPSGKPFNKPFGGKPSEAGGKTKHWFASKDKKIRTPRPEGAGTAPQQARTPERVLAVTPGNDLIYGAHPVTEALKNPRRKPVKLWATENAAIRLKEEAPGLQIEPEIVHPRLLDHMLKSADAVHQGIILDAKPLHQPRLDEVPRDGLIVMLDQVTDPHNVGAIMRSCAAFNVSAVVVTARHSAEASGVFFKAASGAYEHVPYVTVTNLARAMDELKDYGFHLVGLDSEAEVSMDAVPKVRPLALILGAEGRGLRQLTQKSCNQVARIDMPGTIKSLNVSIATAVSLYALTH
jgi:23S rRNA (guanosine2251-2'-O)-methyltransferase